MLDCGRQDKSDFLYPELDLGSAARYKRSVLSINKHSSANEDEVHCTEMMYEGWQWPREEMIIRLENELVY